MTVSCNKSTKTASANSGDHGPMAEAQPFHGEVYRSFDDDTALTLISSEELELRNGKTTLLCKYSNPAGALRVIITTLGTNQVVYYRFTDTGLKDNDGRLLLSPKSYAAAMEQDRKEKELNEKVQQIKNEYDQATSLLLSAFTHEQNSLLMIQRKDENESTSRHEAIANEMMSSYDEQLNKAKKTREEQSNSADAVISKTQKEEEEQTRRAEQAEAADLEKVLNARPTTPDIAKKANPASWQIPAMHIRYLDIYNSITRKYGSKLQQQRDQIEKAYQEEEVRLKSEIDEKILQNNQLQDRELKTIQLTFNKKLDPLIVKRDADLSNLKKASERKIEEWKQKIMK